MRESVVIRFHSVGLEKFQWSYPHISEPLCHFETKMAALSKAGCSTAFFAAAPGGGKDGGMQVVLTFDDGYLDNWVHVFPVLERYGLKATLFVTPEFVDPRDIVREQVRPGAVSNDAHDAGNCCAGFLSWPELREMERSGLVDVQCHALTHTWYFNGPEIVDFWHPGAATEPTGPVWMLWNRSPDLKPYYLTRAADHETDIPFGTPVYEHGKALETRRFFPGDALDELLPRSVREHGGAEFFREPGWRERLMAIVDESRPMNDNPKTAGRYETENDYLERVRTELSQSKTILESHLGKRIRGICWPAGGVNDSVLQIARETGYRYFTLPSAWRAAHAAGRYRDLTPRIGSMAKITWRGRDLGRATPREFVWQIQSAGSSKRHTLLRRAALATRLGLSYLPWSGNWRSSGS